MSQKGKRSNRSENDGPPPIKKRKGRPPVSSMEDDNSLTSIIGGPTTPTKNWQPRAVIDLKMSSIYNRSAPEAPAELFRKDLISAMKLPDSEPLAIDEYWVIIDQWKQEWERGVQVPVNPDSLPEPSVSSLQENFYKKRQDFKLPKNKYIRITKDESFSHDQHYLSNTPAVSESVCFYDLDQCDEAWLKIFNGERNLTGLVPVTEEQFERVVEELEVRCWDKIQAIMKSEEGLGIEYDENVICDVCRSPDSEEANEMVFCDNCNICVHQACYGITNIPSGQWLCRTCSMGQKPDCVLCPNKGGAMKSTRSGQKWAHVSCALWIPEVSIGSVDRMEPITKISSIPASRWALICVLCRERVGACIQCSVKTCKTAYHVTCAFQHGLEMRAIIEDENAEDGVKLRSYCQKHSVNKGKRDNKATNNNAASGSEEETGSDIKRKKRKDMTSEERNQARALRLQEIEAEFDKHVSVKDISCHLLDVDQEGIHYIYNYWVLKRKASQNRPLLPPKSDDADMLSQNQEQADIEKMKMFVHLRQDLERVRNLCYMVSRREKLSRSFFRMREQTFHKQISALSNKNDKKLLDESTIDVILQANHGPTIYDRLYSSDSVNNKLLSLEDMLERMIGVNNNSNNNNTKISNRKQEDSGTSSNQMIKKLTDINGMTKGQKKLNSSSDNNPYKRTYINGTSARRSVSLYGSGLSSESDTNPNIRRRLSTTNSSADDNISKKSPQIGAAKKKARQTKVADRKRRKVSLSAEKNRPNSIESSSEDENDRLKSEEAHKKSLRNRTLRQMERELADDRMHLSDSNDSDDFVPIISRPGHHLNPFNKKMTNIYSDSDSTDKDKTDNTASDSQQHPFRTKAAMKEFNLQEADKLKQKSVSPVKPKLVPIEEKTPEKPVVVEKEKVVEKSKAEIMEAKRLEKQITKDTSNNKKKQEKENSKKANKKGYVCADFLVVPQREAAKKASENLMKTNVPTAPTTSAATKKEIKDSKESAKVENESLPKQTSNISKDNVEDNQQKLSTTNKRNNKVVKQSLQQKEQLKLDAVVKEKEKQVEKEALKEKSKEKVKEKAAAAAAAAAIKEKEDVVVVEKEKEKDLAFLEKLAYVPQRQAAKKAAEHIKSGLGKPAEAAQTVVPDEKPPKVPTKASVASKKEEKKVVTVSSSTSSSSSSTSCTSSSSSDSEVESNNKKSIKPPASKPINKSASTTQNLKKDRQKELPFLDKVSKFSESGSSSSSSDSDSEQNSSESNDSPRKNNRRKSTSTKPEVGAKKQIHRKEPDSKKSQQKVVVGTVPTTAAQSTTTNEKAISSKREESPPPTAAAAAVPAKPLAASRNSKAQNKMSNDRRRSLDIKQGDLSKNTSDDKGSSVRKNSIAATAETKPTPAPHMNRRRKSMYVEKVKDTAVSPTKAATKVNNAIVKPIKDVIVIDDASKSNTLPLVAEKTKTTTAATQKTKNTLDVVVEPEVKEEKASAVLQVETTSDNKSKLSSDKYSKSPKTSDKSKNNSKLLENETNTNLDVIDNKENKSNVQISSSVSPAIEKLEIGKQPNKPSKVDVEEEDKNAIEIISLVDDSHSNSNDDTKDVVVIEEVVQPVTKIEEEDTKVETKPIVIDTLATATNKGICSSSSSSSTSSSSSSSTCTTSHTTNNNNNTNNNNLNKEPTTVSAVLNSIFDFPDELLPTVNEAVNDDAFGLPQQLPFSFTSEMLFKEDCKEDTQRETLHLVEKLRLKYKKAPSVTQDQKLDDIKDVMSIEEDTKIFEEAPSLIEPKLNSPATTAFNTAAKEISVIAEDLEKSKHNIITNNDSGFFNKYNPDEDIENSMHHNKKNVKDDHLDHVTTRPSDERWVPPSIIQEHNQQHPPNDTNVLLQQNCIDAVLQNNQLNEKQLSVPGGGNNQMSMFDSLTHSDKNIFNQSPNNHHNHQQHHTNHQEQQQHLEDINQLQNMEFMQNIKNVAQSEATSLLFDNINDKAETIFSQQRRWNEMITNKKHECTLMEEKQNMLMKQQLQQQQQHDSQQLNIKNHRNKVNDLNFLDIHNQLQPNNNINPMEPYNFTDTSQYSNAVSLFPPAGINVQVPFPSPGAGMFPPNFTNSFQTNKHHHHHHQQQSMLPSQKQQQHKSNDLSVANILCAAAFTSSPHNIALTTAIVSPPVSQQQMSETITSPLSSMISPSNTQNQPNLQDSSFIHNVNNTILGNDNSATLLDTKQAQSQPQQENISLPTTPLDNSVKKSPTKSRTSSRIQNQQQLNETLQQIKSPNISPGKSPKVYDPSGKVSAINAKPKGEQKARVRAPRTNSQSRGAKNKAARGRGRQPVNFTQQLPQNDFDFMSGGTIHNKLVGTVYDLDFDEDIACDAMEKLREMRGERRRSIDQLDRLNRMDSFRSSRESSESPKFSSPNMYSTQTTAITTKHRSSFTPTQIQHSLTSSIVNVNDTSVTQTRVTTSLHDIVNPVLPGPVDMRTYNSSFDSAANTDAYNNHLLGAFASGTADETLPDIDEEQEKALQSALKASNNKSEAATAIQIEPQHQEETNDSDSITKVSLSDSRNIMKLKIKGPLAHIDNSSSSSTTLQQTLSSVIDSNLVTPIVSVPSCNISAASTAGTSNLRRMRKKELLQQYCTQDMNMDDQSGLQAVEQNHSIVLNTLTNRTVGIPKAVDSMCSIPTRDDYKDYAGVDFKKRKKVGNLSRELRLLNMAPSEHDIFERRRSVGSTGSNASSSNNLSTDLSPLWLNKRRSRTNRFNITSDMSAQQAPKLKIKLGTDIMESSASFADRIRPPKKRLAAMPVPSLEDLKRDSMMYREQVMADFDEEKKVKKSKSKSNKKDKDRDRELKRKKRKEKKHKMEIIHNASNDTKPRLIIRFGQKKASDEAAPVEPPTNVDNPIEIPDDPLALDLLEIHSNDYNSSTIKPQMTPIRLKIARNSTGGGYVMTSKKREEKLNKILNSEGCEETKKLNIVLDKLDIPFNETVDLTTNNPIEKISDSLPHIVKGEAAENTTDCSGGTTTTTATAITTSTTTTTTTNKQSPKNLGFQSLSQDNDKQQQLTTKDCEVR